MLLYGVLTNLSIKLGANTFSLFPSPDPPTKLCFFPFLLFSHLFPSKNIFSLEGFHNKATDNAGSYF